MNAAAPALVALSLLAAPTGRAEEAAAEPRLARSDAKAPLYRMRPPPLEEWRPVFDAVSPLAHRVRLEEGGAGRSVAIARGFNAPIFRSTRARSVLGRVRRDNFLVVERERGRCGAGGKGRWAAVDGGGWVCTARDFEIATLPVTAEPATRQPDVESAVPFQYARVTKQGTLRYARVPSVEEERRAEASSNDMLGGLVSERMVGDFFLALDREETVDGRRFWRTVEGEYVRAEHLLVKETPNLVGERLQAASALPIAFVYGEEPAPISCVQGETLEPCGVAEKFARFEVARSVEHGGETWLVSEDGMAIPEARLRVAEKRRPHRKVPAGEKWVHINLKEQTLVAYEGTRPVYATLISSGKETHKTPAGLFRTKRKYLSKTMRGNDPREGIYHVEEVPWTLYYHKGWAVHGAYWHNTFGNVRSHGCTNVAPADARWLYHWTDLEVPDGWQAVVGRQGTWFYFTRG